MTLAAEAGPRPQARFDGRLYAPLVLGAVLNPVNSSMIAVSLVPIGVAFGAPPARTAWLVSALYLATAVGQPVVGRLVDTYGPRPLYLAGTALTGIAGLLGALAPDLGVLIAARVLLGFGTCAGYPAAMYLIRSESRRTGLASPAGVLTALAISSQTVAVIGPPLGGLLIGLGGWRTTFAVNVPLSLAALALGARYLPQTPVDHADADHPGAPRVDVGGILLFATMLGTLLLFLMEPQAAHWWLLLVVVAVAAGFALRELRAGDPFLDLRLLGGNSPLLLTYARTLLTYVVSYAFLYGYTQWLEAGRGLSAAHAGLILTPMFATAIGVSALTGRNPRIRWKLIVGAVSLVVSCALLLPMGSGTPIWFLVLVSLVVGIPQGLNSLANQNAVYHQAEPARIGSAAGLLRTFGYLGAIVAAAAGGAFFGDRADTAGMHELAVFMLAISTLLLAVVLAERRLP